jgi:hypothetical protein
MGESKHAPRGDGAGAWGGSEQSSSRVEVKELKHPTAPL